MRNFGVPVPRGIPAFTVQEAVEAAQKLGGPVWVVKAQIHAGGRGKGNAGPTDEMRGETSITRAPGRRSSSSSVRSTTIRALVRS